MLELHFHSFAHIIQTSEVKGIKRDSVFQPKTCFSNHYLYFIKVNPCEQPASTGLFFPNRPFYPKREASRKEAIAFFF